MILAVSDAADVISTFNVQPPVIENSWNQLPRDKPRCMTLTHRQTGLAVADAIFDLIALLDLSANHLQVLLDLCREHHLSIFRWAHEMVQQYRYLVTLVEESAHTSFYFYLPFCGKTDHRSDQEAQNR